MHSLGLIRPALAHPGKRFFFAGKRAFELGIFDLNKNFFESRARRVAGGDQVATGDERGRADLLGRRGIELLQR